MYMKRTRRYGFTLIEVLVVVAIIALLVAILLPSLARARKLAKDTMCQANLHSIGQGIMLYSIDHKGVLPSMLYDPTHVPPIDTRVETSSSLFQNNQFYIYGDRVLRGGSQSDAAGVIRPVNRYIHSKSGVYRCPLDKENPLAAAAVGQSYTSSYEFNGNSYPYNVALETVYLVTKPDPRLGGGYIPVLYMKKSESIKDTSRLVMAGDTTSVYPQGFTLTYANGTVTSPWYFTFFTHDDKKPVNNLLFVDSHVSMNTMRESPHHIVNSSYSLVLQGTDPTWYGMTAP